jgi:phosphatidylglycerophosphate synthase
MQIIFPHQKQSVLLFLPNLITYFRVILLILAMLTCFKSSITTFCLYCISVGLDSIDGAIAKYCRQGSKVGAILDMSVDRASMVFLMLVPAILYPVYWWFFCALLMLEVGSHFALICACSQIGCTSHKDIPKRGRILQHYYSTQRGFQFSLCLSHDVWFGCVYMYHFYPKALFIVGMIIFAPGFLLKSYINILQLIAAIQLVLKEDEATMRKI